MCKNKSAECVQPDEYPVGIFQQWLQHTLATERGPRAPLVFYIEARSLFQNRRHHREGATTENTQDCFAWGRFGRQVISFAWGDKELYVGGSESHGFVSACVESWPATQIQWTGAPQQQRSHNLHTIDLCKASSSRSVALRLLPTVGLTPRRSQCVMHHVQGPELNSFLTRSDRAVLNKQSTNQDPSLPGWCSEGGAPPSSPLLGRGVFFPFLGGRPRWLSKKEKAAPSGVARKG